MKAQKRIERAVLNELKEWDLSCSEEESLKSELAKSIINVLVRAGVLFAEDELNSELAKELSDQHKIRLDLEDGGELPG